MKETTFKHLRNATFAEKTSHRITKVEKSGKIVANQGIGMENCGMMSTVDCNLSTV